MDDVYKFGMTQHETSLGPEWEKTHELLSGLLDISVDPRFHHEPRHPHASGLVLHITRVRNPQPQAKHTLPKQTKAVLGAVASLCATAERLRLRSVEHLAFWTRVLTSQMMAHPLDASDVAIWWFANHVREREMRIKLEWSERKLEKALLEPITAFLDADWRAFDCRAEGDPSLRLRSMQIALSFKRTELTVRGITVLGSLLARRRSEGPRADRLFEDSLASLEFRETVLNADRLQALAVHVYPKSRPIDELRLDAVFPSGPAVDPTSVLSTTYTAALTSVLKAALDASFCGNNSARSVGLSLSYNRLDVCHLQALFNALRNATRRLTSLSFLYTLRAEWDNPKHWERMMKALEAIACRTSNPPGFPNDDCELNLTGLLLSHDEIGAFSYAFRERVRRSLLLVPQALADGKPVTCQVRPSARTTEDARLHGATDYVIVAVSDTAKVEIIVHQNEAVHSAFVAMSDIVALTVDGAPLNQCRFDRLVLDRDSEECLPGESRPPTSVTPCGCRNHRLITAFAPRLKYLSMRQYRCRHYTSLDGVLHACPCLERLHLDGSSRFLNEETEWSTVFATVQNLRTLRLSSANFVFEDFVRSLVEGPPVPLDHLTLPQPPLTVRTLHQLRQLLSVFPQLQVLEIDRSDPSDPTDEYASIRRDLVRDYHGSVVTTTPLSAPSKLAFLSAVQVLCGHASSIETDVLKSILEMAAAVVTRQILWREVK